MRSHRHRSRAHAILAVIEALEIEVHGAVNCGREPPAVDAWNLRTRAGVGLSGMLPGFLDAPEGLPGQPRRPRRVAVARGAAAEYRLRSRSDEVPNTGLQHSVPTR